MAVPLPAGGTIVAWTDLRFGDPDIALQRVNPDGSFLWGPDGIVLRVAPGGQYGASAVSDGSGGVILAFLDNSYGGVICQRVDAAGARLWPQSGVSVGPVGSTGHPPGIVSDGMGGAIIGWAKSGDIYAQRLSPTGARLWGANGVAVCTAQNDQLYPFICSDAAGGAIMVWQDSRATPQSIYAQRVTATGGIAWQTNGVPIASLGSSNLSDASVAADGGGGAFIAWTKWDSYSNNLIVQHVDPGGALRWGPDGIRMGSGFSSALASDGAGGIFVSWSDGGIAVLVQRWSGDGLPHWPVTTVTNGYGQNRPRMVPDGNGGVFVEWDEPRPDPRATDIYAQRIDAAGRRQWSTGGFCVCAGDGYQFSRTLAHDIGGSVFFVWHHSSPEGRNKLGALGIPLDSPVPALVSLVSVSATPGRVLITWFTSEGPGTRAVVRRRVEGGDWQAVGEVRSDGTGMVAYDDREVAEGGRYGYALRLDSSDGEVAGPETWVDVPRAAGLSIQRIGSNPGASLSVVVSLPDRMPTRLELYDTGGRRLLARELGQLGPGQHTLDVSDAAAIAPGVYQLSLVHGGRRTNMRAVVLR